MSLSHKELNALFGTLDQDAVLTSLRFEGWLAWPLVKERLWRLLFHRVPQRQAFRSPVTLLAQLSLGTVELAINLIAPPEREIAVLYSPRRASMADGRPMHPQLGSLLEGAQGTKYLRLIYDWDTDAITFPRRGVLNERLTGSVLAIAAMALRRRRAVRDLSMSLASRLAALLPYLSHAEIRRTCADQLARFALRRRLCEFLFARAGVRRLVALDPDAKTSEIAAAKALGIPVVEMQHGMFSADEPDYSWTAAHRPAKRDMAVVDRVLVFGPHWQKELIKNGFWSADEIACIGCPGVVAFRQARRSDCRPSRPKIKMVFLTQGYVRDVAIAFWSEALLRLEQAGSSQFQLQIRVHPAETEHAHSYAVLVRRFPNHCEFDLSGSVYSAMVEADIVSGFTSLAMVEAVGLGVPTVSICGGAAPDGFCGVFPDGGIKSIMPHLRQPQDFLDLIDRCRDPAYYRDWANMTAACGASIFAFPKDTFESRLRREIEATLPVHDTRSLART